MIEAGTGGIALKMLVVDRISESIAPEARNADKSAVELMTVYCTRVPADCGGIVAV